MPLPEERYRCKAITREGKRCPFRRLPGLLFCGRHYSRKLYLSKMMREAKDDAK